MKHLTIIFLLSFFTNIGIAQNENMSDDSIYLVDLKEAGYSSLTKYGRVIKNHKYLRGFAISEYKFFIEIPKAYKKVSLYLDDEEVSVITIYNVEKGYQTIFLPTEFKVLWATMDDEVYYYAKSKE